MVYLIYNLSMSVCLYFTFSFMIIRWFSILFFISFYMPIIFIYIISIYTSNNCKCAFPQTPSRRGKDARPSSPETCPIPHCWGSPRSTRDQGGSVPSPPLSASGVSPGLGALPGGAELCGASPRHSIPGAGVKLPPEAATYRSYLRPPRQWPPWGTASSRPSSSPRWGHQALLDPSIPPR